MKTQGGEGIRRSKTADPHSAEKPIPHTHRLRLPGFLSEKDVGLGDVVKSLTYAMGVKPCGGCERRAAVLNGWVVFSPRS